MRCLMCNKQLGEGKSISELLWEDDILCNSCRSEWKKHIHHFKFEGISAMSLWNYEGGFSKALLQFKECNDEALKDTFLYPYRTQVKWFLRGRTLLLMPSSKEKLEQRGFSHLLEMYEQLHLPMMEPFEKISNLDQKGLSAKGREQMLYQIKFKENVNLPHKIAIVDDVITTGATLKGALRILDKSKHDIRIFSASKVENEA